MLHLTTGSPGSGKTLLTLSWVHKLWEETGRPVCYTDKLELLGDAVNWGWKQIDITKWEDEPDGTIFLVDEAQFPFRKSGTTAAPPAWIENLTVHRHRGFDFFLITQNPKYLHLYLRDLIAAPGWHRHIKRKGGAPLVSVLEWESFYPDASDLTSGATALSVTHQALPKEFFDKYKSTSLNTVRFRIPRAFWVMVLGFLAAAALFWYGLSWFFSKGQDPAPDPAPEVTAVASAQLAPGQPAAVDDYLQRRIPRIPDFPHTAPVYDDVTNPVRAPYPAACIEMGKRCECYSQQGTQVATSPMVCRDIVRRGYFVDWDHAERDVAAAGRGTTSREARAAR